MPSPDQKSNRHRLLVVHQSAELYGSDRSLLEFLIGLDQNVVEAIVCLPEDGPLAVELRSEGFEVHVLALVKICRGLFSTRGLLSLPSMALASLRALDSVVGSRAIDTVYTNTLAVLGGALWATIRGVRHVWHIREIVRHPWVVSWVLRKLALGLSQQIICNSVETCRWIGKNSDTKKLQVIWNGVATSASENLQAQRIAARSQLKLHADRPVILLVGRINAFKGHDLLVEAIEVLFASGEQNFLTLMLGSVPPGREDYLQRLQQRVSLSPAADQIRIDSFTHDTSLYYESADILVVPSREPESFGRVAIEAMSYGLPVVAAAHGGLVEIVADGETGVLFQPNNVDSLTNALRHLLSDSRLRAKMGAAGRQRQVSMFSLETYRSKLHAVLFPVLALSENDDE